MKDSIFYKVFSCSFIIASLISACFNVFADSPYPAGENRGIGALGRIEPRSRVIKVSHNAGPEGVRVDRLLFQEADIVKSGEKLAILSDQTKKHAEVEAARTYIKVLEAQQNAEQVLLAFNKKEHLRYQSLKQSSVTSISLADAKHLAFEQSEAVVKRLSAEIANAKSKQRILEAELENTFIYAPITGTILKILAWPGERITGDGLLELADLTQLDVVAEIYESDLSKIKRGQKAHINAPGFKRTYSAQVRELGFQVKKNDLNDTDPLADKDNRIIEVRLTLESQAISDLQHQILRQVRVRIEP